MKKISIILMIFVLSTLLFTACNTESTDTKTDDYIINTVKKVEILDHKFSNYFLTYEEYLKGLKDLFVNAFDENKHYERKYAEIDIRNFTDEQLKNIREKYIKENKEDKVEVEISKIYSDGKYKYVFTKANIIQPYMPKNKENITGIVITRKYAFVKENNDWKIQYIDQALYSNNIPFEKMEYNKFNNKLVQYITKFDPLEN
ncbi:lipopolysaccharide export LptBFGC system permease protein LptF [Caldanaerobacter subterraneus subsp. tengcongensis MB4]|uniref:Uncharacterized protein n=4 Tax=Caldanaerobacter subterraneus TaxID=911092 RepID=Q8RCN1_CALS4|nr:MULTISPECIES: hypothetical protein [Caldanaerobacter]MBE3578462.1 hypothetical protein [Caldanaerobacter subterraneus]AAM23677.1 hypothetical protein TTE0390 [Caldanaerobacter subterraneus subsp. tengcongensis MB4]ERM90804.1 hypothetical protein O163_14060 [Caldanaerobacter subterraneus subsp. yonseiensis KB-1]MCS3916829.1 lipopolysaccharide export LptBFGC system permease protein LptF [Caldanaerobacter subterraneus subsp. tengcongensis MB4]MDI3519531.1 hypothetical protein [Caldanaerobacter